MLTPPGPFAYEQHALRRTLYRLMGETRDLESLCKNVPRLANVIANIARIEAAVLSKQSSVETKAVHEALRELLREREQATGQEESQW